MPSPKRIGDAGEYYVAFALSRLDVSIGILSTNTPGADIIATKTGAKTASIQVKSSFGKNNPKLWYAGKSAPSPSLNFFYVFVNIGTTDCYIIPSAMVSSYLIRQTTRPHYQLDSSWSAYINNWQLILNVL